MIHTFCAAAVIVLVLVSCATPIPLNNISYAGKVSVSSEMSAKLNIISGPALSSDSGWFTWTPPRPTPDLLFHVDDQRAFGESLRAELIRVRLVKSAILRFHDDLQRGFGMSLQEELIRHRVLKSAIDPSTDQRADININIDFAQTVHYRGRGEYTLNVAMELTGGSKPFLKQYLVVSSEGKVKAVKLLLDRLIPDIEAYIAANQ